MGEVLPSFLMVVEIFLSTETAFSLVWAFLVLLWVPRQKYEKSATKRRLGIKVERLTLATELGLSTESLRELGTCLCYSLILH